MKIGLIGAGGMAGEIIALFPDFKYVLYDSIIEENTIKYGFPVKNTIKKDIPYVISVGYPETKVKIVENMQGKDRINIDLAVLTHPSATIGNNVNIGHGSVIYPNVVITNNVEIGELSSIGSNLTVGHDVKIGHMCHLSPGTKISGHCKIGNRVFFGTNSCIKEYITVCDDVIIGAGAVVVKDITVPGKYAGNPARKL